MTTSFLPSIGYQHKAVMERVNLSKNFHHKHFLWIFTVALIVYGFAENLAFAQNWFPTTAPQQTWTSVVLSSDGNKLIAVSSQVPGNSVGTIYASTNAGASWVQTSAPLYHWTCAAGSYDGMNLVAAGGYLNNQIYRSSDSGNTWNPTSAPGEEWQCIASSSDGNVLIAGTYGDYLYVSTNSGASWQNNLSPGYYNLVGCSSLGDILIAAGGLNRNALYISTNYGSAWFQATNAPASIWSSLATSTDGSVIALASGTSLLVSTNTGSTWVSNSLPSTGTGPLSLSGNANALTMGVSGAIIGSTNLGTTWTSNNAPNNVTWTLIASSADGTRFAAVGNNQIYTSPPSPTPKLSVVVWDVNNYGQASVPATVSNAIAIAGSEYDSLAVRSDGTVLAWGYNDIGETNVPPNLANAVSAAASQQLSLTVNNDATVSWWGWSSYTNSIPLLSNIVAVAASQGNFYLALQSNGVLNAWGANSYHQTNVPAGLSNVVTVAVGDYHSMALKNDGTVVVWGGNTVGTSSPTNIPSGLSNVVAIAGGNNYCLAVKGDGSVIGWPTNEPNVVMRIPSGLSNAVAVAADYQHALALTQDGNILEWGTVGTGFLNYQVGLSNAVAIACGYYHSLAIIGDGSPVVIRQPWNQTHFAGNSTLMSAGVVGAPPVAYQWQLNGTNINGATNSFLNLANVQPANAGTYCLVASNSIGITVSSNAILTVIANPPLLILQPTNQTAIAGSNVTFAVAIGAGPIPNAFQWQFNGTNISAATNATLALTNVQTLNQGSYAVVVNNGFGSATSSNAYLTVVVIDFPTALNTPGWTWTTSGSANWLAETGTSHDGVEAAQSGLVANGQSSTLQTTVTGPGTLTYWWTFAPLTSPFANTLSFSSSQGNNSASVNSTAGWQQRTFYLGTGPQSLTWNYSRYSFISTQSTGWVDQVSFTPGGTSPAITSMSANAYVRANSSVNFSVGSYGTPPLAYQWQLNGTNLLNKTNALLSLTSVQLTNAGIYTVIITNSFGTVVTNATLWVGQFALNTNPTNLFLSTNGFQLGLNGILTTNPVVIFGSTDLMNWLPLFTNSATTGSVQFLDVTATNMPVRFYRAQE